MKIITQISMFDDTQNENLGGLERLQKVLENLPDEKLIHKLKHKRKNGRNEWPVEAMWNSLIASFIFDHDSIASLIRELNRNSQLRMICGFQPHVYSVLIDEKDEYGRKKREMRYKLAPTASAYTNFLNNLKECQQELREMFDLLIKYMYENLDDFGTILAADGKAIQSFATKISKNKSGNRGERDATYPEKLNRCKYFLANRGYDSTKLIQWLTTEGAAPIIDIRNLWKGEETRQFKNTDIVYNYKGEVYYISEATGETIELEYRGYDKSRDCQRYGFHPKYHDKRIFRIPLKTDPRIFTKVARNSRKWKRLYKKRTSIERINGRIDRDYKFEKHTIRGLKKMKMFLTVTFIVQLAYAKSKIESGIKKDFQGILHRCLTA